jgi:hypothetical protein
MVKWGRTNSDDLYCGCGEAQDMGHLLSCRDCLVAVERYKVWDISCHARTALWLWRGTRYGTSPAMQGLPCGCGEVQVIVTCCNVYGALSHAAMCTVHCHMLQCVRCIYKCCNVYGALSLAEIYTVHCHMLQSVRYIVTWCNLYGALSHAAMCTVHCHMMQCVRCISHDAMCTVHCHMLQFIRWLSHAAMCTVHCHMLQCVRCIVTCCNVYGALTHAAICTVHFHMLQCVRCIDTCCNVYGLLFFLSLSCPSHQIKLKNFCLELGYFKSFFICKP